MWCVLKNQSREDMTQGIKQACQNIPGYVLLRTISFRRRIQVGIQQNWHVFEYLL